MTIPAQRESPISYSAIISTSTAYAKLLACRLYRPKQVSVYLGTVLIAATSFMFAVGIPVACAQDEPAPQPKAAPRPTGQVSKSKRKATSAQAAVVVLCDLDCIWKLDGEDRGKILANDSAKARIDLGEHVVRVTTTDGKDKIEQPVDLESSEQKVVNAKLVEVRSARLARESADKTAREKQRSTVFTSTNNSEEKTLLDTNRIRLLVRGAGDYLDFELHLHAADTAMLRFDVNKNNSVDANIDVGYGEDASGGCTVYLISAGTSTDCGTFHTEAMLTSSAGIDAGGPYKIWAWHIPRREINAENGDAHFTVYLYNKVTRERSYFPSRDFSQTFRTSLQ
jgi:hypothetical protein